MPGSVGFLERILGNRQTLASYASAHTRVGQLPMQQEA